MGERGCRGKGVREKRKCEERGKRRKRGVRKSMCWGEGECGGQEGCRGKDSTSKLHVVDNLPAQLPSSNHKLCTENECGNKVLAVRNLMSVSTSDIQLKSNFDKFQGSTRYSCVFL